MLRAAFRSKSNKDDEEKSSTSSASKDDDEADSKNQEQSADSELSSEEATTESFHECTEVLKSSKNPNKNKLTKMNNSSLDETLSNEDQQNFPYTERQIYEMQLVQLQEQLVAAMIEDQEKSKRILSFELRELIVLFGLDALKLDCDVMVLNNYFALRVEDYFALVMLFLNNDNNDLIITDIILIEML